MALGPGILPGRRPGWYVRSGQPRDHPFHLLHLVDGRLQVDLMGVIAGLGGQAPQYLVLLSGLAVAVMLNRACLRLIHNDFSPDFL
jgi:hypothetical protein